MDQIFQGTLENPSVTYGQKKSKFIIIRNFFLKVNSGLFS